MLRNKYSKMDTKKCNRFVQFVCECHSSNFGRVVTCNETIPRVFERKRCFGMAGCNQQAFSNFHWDSLRCQNFGRGLRLVKKCCVNKKIFKKLSGRPFRRLPKATGVVPVGAQENGPGPKCLELWVRKVMYVCPVFFVFWKKLSRLL